MCQLSAAKKSQLKMTNRRSFSVHPTKLETAKKNKSKLEIDEKQQRLICAL